MFQKIVRFLIFVFFKIVLSVRYRVKVKGLEKLSPENLKSPGGVLFLPNHSSVFVDPTIITLALFGKFPIRPIIVEYMFYTPIVNRLMRILNALPIPDLRYTANSIKRKRTKKILEKIAEGLNEGDNFLIYPAGRVKLSRYESVAGASGVHTILSMRPEANVVLVRSEGLYGSIFSTALTGKVEPMFGGIFRGIKIALKNLIFFGPRREITLEFMPAPADFPRTASRIELNHWLEVWYNRPYETLHDTSPPKELPGEQVYLVPHSLWSSDVPKIDLKRKEETDIDLDAVPEGVRHRIYEKVALLANRNQATLDDATDLAQDLGLDSLDGAELIAFLEEEFSITGVPPQELTTVGKLLGIATRQVVFEAEEEQEEVLNLKLWNRPIRDAEIATIIPSETVIEAFLKNCDRCGDRVACADDRSGILTYPAVKMRVILLARFLQKLPGKSIGIMLPSSVAASILILAVQLAKKVPVMLNWTLGPKHLQHAVELADPHVILSSWAFVDRLRNVDLDPIEEKLVFLEDLRHELSLGDKWQAWRLSKKHAEELIKLFHVDESTKDDPGVILFTSGTESAPKAVPLTHQNLLSCQIGSLERLQLSPQDTFLGFLPPFHSFGFAGGSLIPLLSGIRVVYYPNPTEGKRLAKMVEKWNVTLLTAAPTFLKGVFKAGTRETLHSLRLCILGAEAIPEHLMHLARELGIEKTLLEGYGITECSPVLTLNEPGTEQVGVGRPINCVELMIVSAETHEPMPQGERGVVLARGPNIFSGYLNRDIDSPFVTVNGESWYWTGDMGYLDVDGHLSLAGRLKRFVKIGGEMVSLGAIESAFYDHALETGAKMDAEVPNIAALGFEGDGKARLVLVTTFGIDANEANRVLRDRGFSNLVKISHAFKLPEIPVMGSGKIAYRQLESQFETQGV